MERGMSVVDDVVALIDRDELVRFTLEICNIDSAVGHEGEVGEHLYKWMLQQGFAVRKLGLLSDRFNVLGTLSGTGGGYSARRSCTTNDANAASRLFPSCFCEIG
jgi:hypothetical protein